MVDVWVLGSANVDVVVRVERHPEPGETLIGGDPMTAFGGKGANQAVAAAVAGARVRMIGAVGDDAEGRAYRERLAAFGIDVTRVRTVAGPTGRAFIAVSDDGENTIIVSPGANAAVGEEDLAELDGIAAGDLLLLQLEVDLDVVASAAKRATAAGARVVLNVAPYADLPAAVLALADPVVANGSEAALLAASGGAPDELLITRGEAGSSWGGLAVPADRVEHVVDTTGAGDDAVVDSAIGPSAARPRRHRSSPTSMMIRSCPDSVAACPRATSRWDLPVPAGPTRARFSGAPNPLQRGQGVDGGARDRGDPDVELLEGLLDRARRTCA